VPLNFIAVRLSRTERELVELNRDAERGP
jgi:hypothetical protein